MWFKALFVLFSCSILAQDLALGQDTIEKKETRELYKDIESYSDRSKFTKFLHRLVFKPVAAGSKKAKVYKKSDRRLYNSYEGKIIRNINIKTLDPFGYSVTDTSVSSSNFLVRAGNRLHIKSRIFTIRNLLLIREGQPFDSLLAKESERLVRKSRYVHDVLFSVVAVSKDSDSVDVYIREMDNWSIIPKGAASSSRFTIDLTDKNFLGLGHEFMNNYTWHFKTGDDAFRTNYHIPNIRNTYINTTLNYGIDEHGNYTRSISADRPFFSPFARWAAGVKFLQQFRRDTIHISDSASFLQDYKFNQQDYWAGNATRIFKGNTENIRTTNFISAIRFLRVRYLDKPIEIYDTLHQYSNENLYLASIGISQRKYIQDKYIFKFGLTEDVPVGKVFSLTGGYQEKNNTGRLYLGARFSYGDYYPWGYLSTDIEYGSFYRAKHAEEGILSASLVYFTGLMELGNWKFRQFVKPQVKIGLRRNAYDSLTLNDGHGIDGFNSHSLTGHSRLMITLQSQSYAPWNLIGFHFGPYFICSLGMLSDPATGLKNSRLYSQIGLGVLIKNDYLVFNTFQISISFYPSIPGVGQDVFKFNSFKTTDFNFDDFEIGKPAIVIYE